MIHLNKLLHFLHQIMTDYQIENSNFKNFLLTNCYYLIYTSINGSKEFFSNEYLAKIETFLPVTFLFLEELKATQAKNNILEIQSENMDKLDAMIFEL